ncbi:methyl-accepting chemotaxis protein [Pseudooceanicola nitratireducens]|uniref:methyl-accepting chemotaxis protein n=1 Tax=Pseudooceanicola nitratireducens TaxID=517719 RepID=UPI001C93B4D6|nr:methyl-accepting chemotaxis protein [Pseudooceanicola nitratireducens]MBY6157331.1 HAMP domain-containing protein [Pseudooceanicola nitratireducens]
MPRFGISGKIVSALIVLSGLSIAVIGTLIYFDARSRLIEDGRRVLQRDAAVRAVMLTEWGKSVEGDIGFQATSPSVSFAVTSLAKALDRQKEKENGQSTGFDRSYNRSKEYFSLVADHGGYRDVVLTDASGRVVFSLRDRSAIGAQAGALDPTLGGLVGQMIAGKEPVARISDFARQGQGFRAFAGQVILSQEQVPIGAIVLELDSTRLAELSAVGEQPDDVAHSYVVDASGIILAGAPDLAGADAIAEGDIRMTGVFGDQDISRLDGEDPSFVAFAPVRILGKSFALIVEEAEYHLVADATDFGYSTLIRGTVLILLAGGLAYGLTIFLVRPINRMTEALARMQGGDYSTRVQATRSGDELQVMGEALDGLRQELEVSLSHQAENVRRSAALQATSAALMMTDSDFNITYMNPAVISLLNDRLVDFRTVDANFDPYALIGVNMDRFHKLPEVVRKRLSRPENLPFSTDIHVGQAFIQLKVDAMQDDAGDSQGLVLEWLDVTELRGDQAVLKAIHEHQSKAEFDLSGRLGSCNARFREACQFADPSVASGQIDRDLVHFDGDKDLPVLDTVTKGDPVTGLFRHLPTDAIFEGGVFPIKDRSNATSAMLFIGKDISESHRQMAQAEAYRKQMAEVQTRVVETLSIGMKAISAGDLTHRLTQDLGSDYEQLRSDFNSSTETLSQAIASVFDETSAMRQETAEIVKAADEMARRTEMQASTLQQTASSLDELTQSVASTSDGTQRANALVSNARSSAQDSGEIVQAAEQAMSAISESSKEVVEVISLIEDIAFQTNLLALNAGVEAARAGEAGRGFAVVATEVRALAQRCSDAASEISDLISRSGQHVSHGVELVGKTGAALKGIVESIAEVASHIDEIARAGEEQSKGLGQINQAVNDIDHNTQQNAAMFEETTAAAHALAHRVEALVGTVGQFNIGVGRDFSSKSVVSEIASPSEQKSSVATGTHGADSTSKSDEWREF